MRKFLNGRSVQASVLAGFLGLCLSVSLSADPVTLEVSSGSGPGFSYTTVHAATGCQNFGGVSYCNSGVAQLSGLAGNLGADLVGSVLSGISGLLTGTSAGGDLNITGGSLDFSVGAGDQIGWLDYIIVNTSVSGTFYFYNENFAGSPNSLTGGILSLWGNNWENPLAGPGGAPLGLDLHASVVPVPAALWLFGTALAGFGATMRRRNQAKLIKA